MQKNMMQKIQEHHRTYAVEHARQLSAVHLRMLALRDLGMRQISQDISHSMGFTDLEFNHRQPVLFGHGLLEEFASGDIVKCLGKEYEIYRNRRCPRIPNGDLMLMSRIMKINGLRGEFNRPAQIFAEQDLPQEAWYFDASPNGELPLSIMLEMALQPCGVLSAWLGTQLRYPHVDFFFRNLDGEGFYLKNLDLRGKTINSSAKMTKTTFSGATIIQHFEFELACDGQAFFKGSSSFGYFPEETMATQTGLDGGKPSLPWGKEPENSGRLETPSGKSPDALPGIPAGKLRLIDAASFCVNGGLKSKGYMLASRRNSPNDWFFANHFFQDPVMPGSLGIEAAVQAFRLGIPFITGSHQPVSLASKNGFQWKYRGQVLQNHRQMQVEVHVQDLHAKNGKSNIAGNANLWADDIRIYEIKNLVLQQD